MRLAFLGLAMLLVIASDHRRTARADDVRSVGVAAVDITPESPIRLSGFGFRRTESEGITQRIWAKALAIGDESPVVLVTVDSCGLSAAIINEAAARIEKQAGIPRERIAVTVTHTHTAPMVRGVLPNLFGQPIPPEHQEHIDRYTRELIDALERVALAALADRQPARLFWGIGQVNFAINRRVKDGPVDRDLPVLVVKNPQGKVRAAYLTYACHCVTLSHNKISGDWAGFAQSEIQQQFPGAVAMVSIGCGAESNPSSGVSGDRVDLAAAQGAEIAAEVKRLLGGYLAPVSGTLRTQWRLFDLPLAPLPSQAEWEELAKRTDALGYNARVQLERLKRGEPLKTKVPYPVQTWTFGESLAMVFLPGEVVGDYSLRLKRELDGLRLWINAYSNDVPCYIPSERVLKLGSYEGKGAMVYYDVPAPFAPGLEARIVAAVHQQLEPTFRAPFDVTKVDSRPLPPQQAIKTLKTHDELTIDLVAAEPLVVDPVAIAFGPDGRLWVAEMADYPSGVPERGRGGEGEIRSGDKERGSKDTKRKSSTPPLPHSSTPPLESPPLPQPGGRIRVLSDTDGDGTYDRATVFLDGIPFPTGVTVWRNGVLVCAAPDILYAEDTNGDQRADVVRKLFSGFGTHNYQARVNSLEYGLDGWVYGSCGLFGGDIQSVGQVSQPAKECQSHPNTIHLGDRDFRIDPDCGLLEPATGRTQQGRVRNDWGDWFGCTNGNLCIHYALADHYLRRNPHVAPAGAIVTVAEPDANRLVSIRPRLQLFKLSGKSNLPTAACGIGVYRDDLLGSDYQGDIFTCEPVHLVVHRLKLSPNDSTFTGRRAANEADSEFLATTDNWFRPVQARTGPDGALWILDMQRYVIEHPRWIPPEELAKVDVRAGDTLGRIYRIRPKDQPLRTPPKLDRLDTNGLVAALDTANGWQRDMAAQMLLWREDHSAAAPLRSLFASSQRPEARLQALCVLDGLKRLRPEAVQAALNDEHPGVRRQAIRLAERFVNTTADLGPALLNRVGDPDPQVRLQLAFSLGEWQDARVGTALADLLRTHGDDAAFTAAAMSSVNHDNLDAVLTGAFLSAAPPPPRIARELLSMSVAIGETKSLPEVLRRATVSTSHRSATWQVFALVGYLEGLARKRQPLEQAADRELQDSIAGMLDQARRTVADPQATENDRINATQLLGRDAEHRAADLELLTSLLVPQNSTAMQSAALEALGRLSDERVAEALLHGWKSYTLTLRTQALDVLLRRPAWQRQLLAALKAGEVPLADLDPTRRQRLLSSRDDQLRSLAEEVFAGGANTDRRAVVEQYRDVPSLSGDRTAGRTVFLKRCAGCHRLENEGFAIGPNLAALTNKSPEFLLTEILDPNRNVDSRYVEYAAVTTDGRTFTGLLASESGTSLTLKGQENRQHVLLRADLDEFTGTGRSIMPEGLEKDLTRQDLANLIAYVLNPGGVGQN